jgi:DNA-binding NarL/FixJ family response regulator
MFEQLFQGLTNKEIATTLRITEQTLKDHLKRIMHRIGVTTLPGHDQHAGTT